MFPVRSSGCKFKTGRSSRLHVSRREGGLRRGAKGGRCLCVGEASRSDFPDFSWGPPYRGDLQVGINLNLKFCVSCVAGPGSWTTPPLGTPHVSASPPELAWVGLSFRTCPWDDLPAGNKTWQRPHKLNPIPIHGRECPCLCTLYKITDFIIIVYVIVKL